MRISNTSWQERKRHNLIKLSFRNIQNEKIQGIQCYILFPKIISISINFFYLLSSNSFILHAQDVIMPGYINTYCDLAERSNGFQKSINKQQKCLRQNPHVAGQTIFIINGFFKHSPDDFNSLHLSCI